MVREKFKKTNSYKNVGGDKSWIPVDYDGGGDGFYIDLNPGPKGKVGQIIFLSHETGPDGPHFPDFVAYLEDGASKLEAGKY